MNRILPKPPALQVTSVFEFIKKELPPREHILAPWLPVQGLTMIYAPRGIGKTHVALGIAHAVANGITFLNWNVRSIPESPYEQVINMAKQGLKQKEIAEKMNLDKSGVSRYIKTAYQEGRIQ